MPAPRRIAIRAPYVIAHDGRGHRLLRDGVVVVEADSSLGGSGLFRKIRIDPHRNPIVEWRWLVPPESGAGGDRGPSESSPPVRLALAFDGDVSKLDFDDRAKLRLAKALTANGLPYASLLYVWMTQPALETIYSSPHTERVRYLVVEHGEQRLGQWVVERRNILADYRRAFHEEPGDIVGVGIIGFCCPCGKFSTTQIASLICSSVGSGGIGMPCICICICMAQRPLMSLSRTSIPQSRRRSVTSVSGAL